MFLACQHQAEKEKEVARIEAEKKKMVAEIEAEALLITANAEAEANRILSDSLTERLIKLREIEKWDGKLPTVYGDGTTSIVQVP